MEHRQQPNHPPHSRRGGITTPQIAVLFIVGILNIGLLALAVVFLAPGRTPPAARPTVLPTAQAPASGLDLSPTWTAGPVATPAANAGPGPAVPQIPASCAETSTEIRQGTITRVIDRETIEVEINGALATVAFAGLSFPPALSGLGVEAEAALQSLADGLPVILAMDVSGQDGQGRMVRYVFAGGRFLNVEIVRLGYAQADPNAADQACAVELQQAEQQARAVQVGMWRPTPVPTRTFVPFVTVDPNTACDCSIRFECSDFNTHADAQACFNACNDYNSRLDEDHDGLACEGLP